MNEPNLLLFLLNIAGPAALLIWSVRLVRTGVERAFSTQLRLWLRRSNDSRFLAAVTGGGAAVVLQSATAVAILTAGFVGTGALAVPAGLAILMGADVGSALVAQILLVRLPFLVPLLLLCGVAIFLRGQSRRLRQTGRIFIGLALIFISLDLIRGASAPLTGNAAAGAVMEYLSGDPITAFVLAALFTWLVHSSVAAILLFVTLVGQGLMPVAVATAMVLGANLGGSIIAYVLTLASPVEARRFIAANVALRGGGAALVLFAILMFNLPLDMLGGSDARQIINLHLVFNLGLAALFVPFAGPVARVVEKLVRPKVSAAAQTGLVSALDPAALQDPPRALSCAARELVRMGETIEAMLRSILGLYRTWDDAAAEVMEANNRSVQKMLADTKIYLATLNRGALEDEASHRAMDMSTTAVNLAAGSDMIARKMLGLARRLENDGIRFSDEGREEIEDFHDRVLANAQLALDVLMAQNPDSARELVRQKDQIREIEQDLQLRHLARLQRGVAESIETSNIHLDTLRGLKLVNTSFTMVAYPILSESGDLLASRLSGSEG